MERRQLQRTGYAVGGLVLVIVGIVLLRNTDTPSTPKAPPAPPVQTTVRAYADEGVLVPQPGAKPPPPKDVRIVSGMHRLQVTWTQDPAIAGYEVQVHGNGVDRTKLVADDAAQFDSLTDGDYEISVQAVDGFGQRSDPVTKKDRPARDHPDESKYALVDHFDHKVPDETRWRLANNAACARMSRGAGEDDRRLVISAACGNESVALRSRTPLRLKDNTGRLMIETDSPGESGEMTVDLVPGPVDLIETSERGGPPPGTIRARITGKAVEILGAPPIPIEPLHNGISVRWEFALSPDGIQVWRNGNLAGVAHVVATWTEATPLFEFTGPPNGLTFVAIDAIGLSNADTPAFVPPPRVSTTAGGAAGVAPVFDQLGGQLRLTIRSSYGEQMPGPFTVKVGNETFPLRPAVVGQQFESGLRYPVVADIPEKALVVSDRNELTIRVQSGNPNLAPQVQHADIELVPDPAHPVTALTSEPQQIERPRPVLATATAVLLDAAGGKIEDGKTSPTGRVVLEIALDGAGPMAGLAGVEIWVDDKRIAGIPTNHDGPGIGGHWRVALNTGSFQPGIRNLQLKLISTDGISQPQFTTLTWHIPT